MYVSDTNRSEGTDKIETCTTHLERPSQAKSHHPGTQSSPALGSHPGNRTEAISQPWATAPLATTTKETNHAKDPHTSLLHHKPAKSGSRAMNIPILLTNWGCASLLREEVLGADNQHLHRPAGRGWHPQRVGFQAFWRKAGDTPLFEASL